MTKILSFVNFLQCTMFNQIAWRVQLLPVQYFVDNVIRETCKTLFILAFRRSCPCPLVDHCAVLCAMANGDTEISPFSQTAPV